MFTRWLNRGFYLEEDSGMGGGTPEPAEPVAEPVEPQMIQVGDGEYTPEQIQAALETHKTRETWESEFNRKSQELNTMARAVETAYQTAATRQPAPQEDVLTPEKFRDLLIDDPARAMELLDQRYMALSTQSMQSMKAEEAFYNKYPDYNEVVGSPEFQAFKQSVPGWNDVNAYFAYKLDRSANQSAQVTEETKKAIEAEIIKNLQAKGVLNTTLKSTGPPPQPSQNNVPMSPADARQKAIEAIHAGRAAKGMTP